MHCITKENVGLTPGPNAFVSSHLLPVKDEEIFILRLVTANLCIHSNCEVTPLYLSIVTKGSFPGDRILFIALFR